MTQYNSEAGLSREESGINILGNILPYIIVAKPFVVFMVLVSTLSGMYMAGKALPEYMLIFWTLLGTGLATGGAAALNNYIDRDIDLVMKRTRSRPVPSGSVDATHVLVIGLTFSALSMAVCLTYVNTMVAILCASAILIYVVAYTMLSKRRTPLATYIGGVGGALPPVIGYAAIKPELDIFAFILFVIIFAWQHPHFWSLALKYIDEYKQAGVRNHAVAMGVDATKLRIAVWSVILAVVSLLPFYYGMSGSIYLLTALLIGLIHISMSLAFMFSTRKLAMNIFFFSLIQLPALYFVMIMDVIL